MVDSVPVQTSEANTCACCSYLLQALKQAPTAAFKSTFAEYDLHQQVWNTADTDILHARLSVRSSRWGL